MKRAVAVAIVMLTAACTAPSSSEPIRQAKPALFDADAATSAATSPGVPGTPNCRGQTARFVSQGDAGLADSHGIGGLASLAGLTVDEVNQLIETYCAGPQ